MKDLAVIIPVYNEEGAIENVINKWTQELDKYNIDYNICAYNYDFLVGIRDKRIQSLPRKIISMVSRLTIKIFYGINGPYDVNSPYRLIRSEKFLNLFEQIPSDTFAPNVIISGFVANKNLSFFETPVDCKLRQTGEVSIQKLKLLKAAIKSFIQTIKFSFKLKGIKK